MSMTVGMRLALGVLDGLPDDLGADVTQLRAQTAERVRCGEAQNAKRLLEGMLKDALPPELEVGVRVDLVDHGDGTFDVALVADDTSR